MSERYLPPSRFLRAIIDEEVVFGDRDLEDRNLLRLIALTRDDDVANRDWAVLLLAQLEINRSDVRQALSVAADDPELIVRSEAILGLAQIDHAAALPFLQRELKGQIVTVPLLEAAQLVAHPSLLHDLEAFCQPSDDEWIDKAVEDAVTACRTP